MSASVPGRRPVPAEHAGQWEALLAEFGARWLIRTGLLDYRAEIRDPGGYTPIPFTADTPNELAGRLRELESIAAMDRKRAERRP